MAERPGTGESGPGAPPPAASRCVSAESPASQVVSQASVVLDVGNVLCCWDPAGAVVGRVGLAEWDEFVREADFGRWNTMCDAGVPFGDVVAALEAAHPGRPDWVRILRAYREGFLSALTGPVPGMTALVDELLATGTPLYALTNFDAAAFNRSRHLVPHLERFRGVVVSGEEHLTKPDPGIYQVLLHRYGLAPSRTVLVDDSPANVATARGLGMTGLVFTGAGRLRLELVSLGVMPARPGPPGGDWPTP